MPLIKRQPSRMPREPRIRINEEIRAPRLRVVDADGEYLDVLTREEAITRARDASLDLIEISPQADPPVAKIMEYGKFQYERSKKARGARSRAHFTETKTIQVRIATGEHDLALKAKRVSEWLSDGDRIKIDLFLPGRAKYLDPAFLEERLRRILNLITAEYRIAEPPKKSPKGLSVVIERTGKK